MPRIRSEFSFLNTPQSGADIHKSVNRPTHVTHKTSTVEKPSTVDSLAKRKERPYRIHKCILAQDAHSHGENQLYHALWTSAKDETAKTRLITIGWGRMAQQAGMSDKAAKRNMLSLIHKLAVELVQAEGWRGRTYRIYSFKAILARREQAGLEYVVKDKGVRFVMATGEPDAVHYKDKTSTVDKTSRDTPNKTSTDSMDKTSRDTVDKTSRDTVDKTSPPLGSSLGKELETSSLQEEIAQVAQAMSRYFFADDEAAKRLIRDCREHCPDAQVDEITAVIDEKAAAAMRNPAVKNPVGLLLTVIPRCFASSSIVENRKQLEAAREANRQREQARRRRENEWQQWAYRERSRCEAILDDSLATAAQKEQAKRTLAQLISLLDSSQSAVPSE